MEFVFARKRRDELSKKCRGGNGDWPVQFSEIIAAIFDEIVKTRHRIITGAQQRLFMQLADESLTIVGCRPAGVIVSGRGSVSGCRATDSQPMSTPGTGRSQWKHSDDDIPSRKRHGHSTFPLRPPIPTILDCARTAELVGCRSPRHGWQPRDVQPSPF